MLRRNGCSMGLNASSLNRKGLSWLILAFGFSLSLSAQQAGREEAEQTVLRSKADSSAVDSPHVLSIINLLNPAEALRRSRRKPEPKGNFNTLVLPIKRAGNLLLIEAKAGDVEGNFILDLGAPYLVLNRTYFRSYERVYGASASDLTGTVAPVFQTRLPRLQIGELFYEHVDADVADLGEIENRRGAKILGLLGVELFLNLGLTVDLLHDVVYLHRLNEGGDRVEPNDLDLRQPAVAVPFRLMENTVVLDVVIADKALRFALDSGAEVNVLDFNINRKVLQELKVEKRITLHGAAGGKAEVLAGTLPEYQLGGRNFKGGKTIVANLEAMGKSGAASSLDGMLGFSFFDQGIVRLNFLTKELWWYPYVDESKR